MESAIEAAVQNHIQQRAAEIEEQAAEQANAAWEKLNELNEEAETLQQSLAAQKRTAQKEIAELHRQFEESTANDRRELAASTKQLDEDKELFETHVRPVAERLTSARDDILNQFVTLSPLLTRVGIANGTLAHKTTASQDHFHLKHGRANQLTTQSALLRRDFGQPSSNGCRPSRADKPSSFICVS